MWRCISLNKSPASPAVAFHIVDYDDLLVPVPTHKNWQGGEAALDARVMMTQLTFLAECGLPPLHRLSKRNKFEVVSRISCAPICCDNDEVETQVLFRTQILREMLPQSTLWELYMRHFDRVRMQLTVPHRGAKQ